MGNTPYLQSDSPIWQAGPIKLTIESEIKLLKKGVATLLIFIANILGYQIFGQLDLDLKLNSENGCGWIGKLSYFIREFDLGGTQRKQFSHQSGRHTS